MFAKRDQRGAGTTLFGEILVSQGVITSRGVDYVVSGQEPGRVPSWVLR